LLVYWVVVAVTCAFDYYRKYREREVRAIELEKLLAQAKLQALRMQLNPHFLFNSLHSISALMHKNVDAADRMISRLGELLRAALDNTETQEVSLGQELQFLRGYLELEQIRFGSRLEVEIRAGPEALEARVPNLILQPLVENAIRHGIEPHARPGRIRLLAWARKPRRMAWGSRTPGPGCGACMARPMFLSSATPRRGASWCD
jgi:LytS/YehU family sensor histidine kinase